MTKFNAASLSEYTRLEKLMLLTAVSIFLPIYVMPVMPLVLFFYVMRDKHLRSQLFMSLLAKPLFIFFPLLLVVPLAYQNFYGLATAPAIMIIMVLAILFCIGMSRKLHEAVLDIFCLGSVAAFLVAVTERLLHLQSDTYRVCSLFMNPNYYGTVIEMVALVCVYKVVSMHRPRRIYVIIGLMNLFALYLCDCRSAWIPIFLGTFLIMLMNRKCRLFVFTFIIFIASLLLIYKVPALLPRAVFVPDDGEARFEIWKTALKGFRLSPLLGQGPFSYIHVYKQFDDFFTYHAHNTYLEWMLSYGIIGLGAVIWYFYLMVRAVFRARFKIGMESFSLTAAVFVGMAFHGFFDYTLFYPQTSILFFMLIGGQLQNARPESYEKKHGPNNQLAD